ncbi:MAG: bifunctional oligoribonuclease/PAP phosphatase NrnA [Fusobacterium sp.]|nr:bifunctional oligoribonuclease/PAP phosphatase NrnA [Fusobacterium sp.]
MGNIEFDLTDLKEKLLSIKSEIEKNRNIILTAHINPDGDAVGSGLALYLTLKKEYSGKNIRFILQDDIPYTTKFLKYSDEIEKYDKTKEYETELLIYLDSATKERTGVIHENIKASKTINIDHHVSNPDYADINCVIRNFSSTSQIIYNFIKICDYEFTKEIAEALYLGLVNDTGNFSHSNVTKDVFEMALTLVGEGVIPNYIVNNFLNSNSYAALKIVGYALNKFEYFQDKKLAYIFISTEIMKKYKAKKEDTETIVEKILSYSEASVSLFLREEENGIIKGSMRSKYEKNVNEIAAIFGGGGHHKAAGFSSSLSCNEILKIILEKL